MKTVWAKFSSHSIQTKQTAEENGLRFFDHICSYTFLQ